ncbi:hypothetical protein BDY21DRAFT_355400 [Lineolata rhizophorae]|uniref:Uncharacterized protein n=1 Tax=Lineolata rhizophorae TaxID=578093 RepID=A0A6A6NPD0_9PEZI|nr:hypothetical protein BDY21DRAFT_355400 [Lineolata rhizophorae]
MTSAVNRPMDVKMKEKDINNKLQFFGIYSAFARGKVPSNKQIDVAMNSFLESKALASPSKKLSPEGQKLVGEVRDVVEQAKLLLLTKNEGNLLQDFIWQTQQLSGTAGEAQKPGAPVDKETAQQHGNEALEGLRTLGTLLITNGQFRKLLNDATIIMRDMIGDAATSTAKRAKPSEDQLNQLDQPAEDNTWHDVPDVKAMRENAKERYNQNKPFAKDSAKKATENASATANPEGNADPAATADAAANEQPVNANGGLKAGADTLKAQAAENTSDETKEKAKTWKTQSKEYFSGKMPQERREQTIWRLKKMVVEIQGHQDYLRAIETLLRLAETYGGHGRTVAKDSQGKVKGAHSDDSLQIAEADLKTLIERFANGTSLDDLFDSINAIYRDAEKDPELRQWFKDVDGYVRKCLKEQGFIMEDAAKDDWNGLYDRGRSLLRERYRTHTDRVVDEFKFIGKQFDEDPQNKAFSQSLQKLVMDLGNDENGKPVFKKHLVKDLTDVIIPAVFEHTRYVPVPRIEISDPMVDCVIENLVVESDNLAPNAVEFSSDNYWRWGRKKIANKNKNKVMLSSSGTQMDLKDVSYYVKKKQGFPSITDTGVMDVFMGGQGFSFKIEMENSDKKDKTHFFKVNKVDVDIKDFKIKVKQSKHKLLFSLFKPVAMKALKPAVQKALEKQIKDSAIKLDALLFSVHQEAEKAKEDAKRDPSVENVQNIYQRYLTAVKNQLAKGETKAQEATQDKKVNMAVTQHEAIFKDISLPGGVSSKATEFRDLAAKGDKWESPVFSIGSAKETQNLPKAPSVARKPHGSSSASGNALSPEPSSTKGFGNEVDKAFGTSNGTATATADNSGSANAGA